MIGVAVMSVSYIYRSSSLSFPFSQTTGGEYVANVEILQMYKCLNVPDLNCCRDLQRLNLYRNHLTEIPLRALQVNKKSGGAHIKIVMKSKKVWLIKTRRYTHRHLTKSHGSYSTVHMTFNLCKLWKICKPKSVTFDIIKFCYSVKATQ